MSTVHRNPLSTKLWLVVAILAVSNLVTAFAAVYLLGRLEERTVAIFETGVPELSGLRELAKQSANAHRYMLAVMLAEDPSEAVASSQHLDAAIAANRTLLSALTGPSSSIGGREARMTVREAGEAYLLAAAGCRDLVLAGRLADARAARIAHVRPAYEEFQARQARLAATVADIVESSTREGTAEAARYRRLFYGLGSWPIMGAVVVLGLFASFSLLILRTLSPVLREKNTDNPSS